MSGPMDTLCLRLIDLARAQHAALAAGDLDEALATMGQRLAVESDIQKIDGGAPARNRPGQSVDGLHGPSKGLSATNRSAIETVLSIDRDMAASLRTAISEAAEMLSVIRKLRKYRDRASAPVQPNDQIVVA